MEKKVLCVDIDDCLASYVETFIPYVKTKHGFDLKREDISGSLEETGIDPSWIDSFREEGALAFLKPVRRSGVSIRKLAKYFEIIAITSRPEDVEYETRQWLKEYFPDIRGAIFTKEKGAACRELNAWGLIEDQIQYAKQFGNTFMIEQPWNEGWSGFRGNWKEVTDRILSQVRR
jgi:5'(3')-deoxyribonucleotidase